MAADQHSLLSSYREMLLEHLFSGEVMRHVWLSRPKRLEILKPQVDDGGYDLVLEVNSVVRHIQLKGTFLGSKTRRFKVNSGLASKPSGCVIVLVFDPKTLELGPFLWYGARPGKPLPSIEKFPIAKHTKGNAEGLKGFRPNIRVLPLSAFTKIQRLAEISEKLFGALD